MGIAFYIFLSALSIYLPYLLADKNELRYKGEIILDKSPKQITVNSGFIILLAFAAFVEFRYQIKPEDLGNNLLARILAGFMISYLAMLSVTNQLKGFRLRNFDILFLIASLLISAAHIFEIVTPMFFAGYSLTLCSYLACKYLNALSTF